MAWRFNIQNQTSIILHLNMQSMQISHPDQLMHKLLTVWYPKAKQNSMRKAKEMELDSCRQSMY